MEKRAQELNSFKELVKKTDNAEVKAALRPHFYACETDQHCFWRSWPLAAKASIQGQLMKDPRVKKPKFRPQNSKALAFQRSFSAETLKKARKKKKKNNRQNRRDCYI